MIMRLLTQVTPWLLAALIGIATYAGMQARHHAAEADAQAARADRAEDRAEILLEHQRWQSQQIEALGLALAERDEQLERDDEILTLLREGARDLERDDAETGDWAAEPVPDAVGEWLRSLPRDPDGAGGGDADTAASSADAADGS